MKTFNFISDKELENFLNNNKDFTFLHFTGNMFGIGAPVSSRNSIQKINNLKGRDNAKGYIILIPDADWLNDLHLQPDMIQKRLMRQYWPGELTLIFKDLDRNFPDITKNERIAVRVPGDPFLRKFLEMLSIPVISTSINRSGSEFETDINVINSEYSDWFDFNLLPQDLKYLENTGSTIVDTEGQKINVLREGAITEAEIRLSAEKPLILFVCTGNICRSPLAEYYARKVFQDAALPVRVRSAGFLDSGNPISENSRIILQEIGIDSHLHRSIQIDEDLIRQSWIILTMENRHKLELNRMDPNISGKVFTLSEFCGSEFCKDSLDIDDPYGQELKTYRFTFEMIKRRIDCLVAKIREEV